MKKIKLILFLFFVTNIYSQVTVELPLGTYEYPSGAYLKDVNYELNKYIGTWEGILNNKKYIFVFQLFPQRLTSYPSGLYHYADELKVKFKVIDLVSNTTLYNGLNATAYEDFPIYTGSKPYLGLFQLWFTDTPANCKNELMFYLKDVSGVDNQLKYCYFEYYEWMRPVDCPFANQIDIPVLLPKEDLILTKQP